MVAYAQALQSWVEKVDPPMKGKPCLLAESVKELREEMRCYLSFAKEDMFKGVALLEETSTIQMEEADPQSARSTPANTLEVEATVGMAREPTVEKRPPIKFPGWEKVLHPSQPMVAAGQIPPPSRDPRLRPSVGNCWAVGSALQSNSSNCLVLILHKQLGNYLLSTEESYGPTAQHMQD